MILDSTKVPHRIRDWLSSSRLPLVLALTAVIFMLPALWTDLLGDDVIQRLTQLKTSELPAHALDTGFVGTDSGTFTGVLLQLFGYPHGDDSTARSRNYGIAPWWAPENWQARLFRPVTAFTHWLDYRLYPRQPVLMHAHSIGWYALAVFLAATLYRKVAVLAFEVPRPQQPPARANIAPNSTPAVLWVPGLAACLFLLDKNTYFPVMYVANRGFIIALVFGLLCLHAHVQWRTSKGAGWMWLSGLCLGFSVLANEGGASTLAFLLAYALVLEQGRWSRRVFSLLPAAVVLGCWRAVYVSQGFGVKHFTLYIDPGYEPWLFLKHLPERLNGLLGGQLTAFSPELALGMNSKAQWVLALCFAMFNFLCAVAFVAVLRRDRAARFWAVVMLLALVPAATVSPISKNLTFVSVGAFGVIACILAGLRPYVRNGNTNSVLKLISCSVASLLVIAHVPAALACRLGLAIASPSIPEVAAYACSFRHVPDTGDKQLVCINDPTIITAVAPFERAYRGLPLPEKVRILVPGSTRLQVTRQNACSLVVKAVGGQDLFDCPDLGPMSFVYACKAANDLLFGNRASKVGECVTCEGFVATILELGQTGLPRAVAFTFDRPLESEQMVWMYFDWRRFAHLPFVLPQVGQTVDIAAAGVKR